MPGLPRTNNDLKQLFGSQRYQERRATGRKAASPAVVLRGEVRLIAAIATRRRPPAARDLGRVSHQRWHKLGTGNAAEMLILIGDNPERIHSEAARAKLCGACPIPASSASQPIKAFQTGLNVHDALQSASCFKRTDMASKTSAVGPVSAKSSQKRSVNEGKGRLAQRAAEPLKASSPARKTPALKSAAEGEKEADLALTNGTILGDAIFFRKGGEVIETVDMKEIEVSVGSREIPVFRLRSEDLHSDVVAEIPKQFRVKFSAFKKHRRQYLFLLMAGATLRISSQGCAVVADRHPDFEHDVIDDFLDSVRAEARKRVNLQLRLNAEKAAINSQDVKKLVDEIRSTLETHATFRQKAVRVLRDVQERDPLTEQQRTFLRRLLLNKERLADVEWDIALADLVASLLDRHSLTSQQQAKLDILLRDEAFKALVEEKRQAREGDLDRTPVGH